MPIPLGVGLLFGGWVGAEALSRGPARLDRYIKKKRKINMLANTLRPIDPLLHT